MQRTVAPGNDNNLYTEGDPGLSIPATVVGALEMNNIQEELCNFIESVGITLDSGDLTQLEQAIDQTVLNLNLGDAAFLDVGTTPGTVAAGDDSRFHSNANDPTSDQKAAMDNANGPTAANPFLTLNDGGGGGGGGGTPAFVSAPFAVVTGLNFPIAHPFASENVMVEVQFRKNNTFDWMADIIQDSQTTNTFGCVVGITSTLINVRTANAGVARSGNLVNASPNSADTSGEYRIIVSQGNGNDKTVAVIGTRAGGATGTWTLNGVIPFVPIKIVGRYLTDSNDERAYIRVESGSDHNDFAAPGNNSTYQLGFTAAASTFIRSGNSMEIIPNATTVVIEVANISTNYELKAYQ